MGRREVHGWQSEHRGIQHIRIAFHWLVLWGELQGTVCSLIASPSGQGGGGGAAAHGLSAGGGEAAAAEAPEAAAAVHPPVGVPNPPIGRCALSIVQANNLAARREGFKKLSLFFIAQLTRILLC